MIKYYLMLFVCVLVLHCKPTEDKDKTYYFYNAKVLFQYSDVRDDSIYYLNYETALETLPTDSFSIGGGWKIYGLKHYYKFSNHSDTSFVKHKSYLDSIDYYSTEWFKKEKNLDKFWKSSNGSFDAIRIYTIEPIEGTDSIIFRRVHRSFHEIG